MNGPVASMIRPVRGERLLPPLRRQGWLANEGGVSLVLHAAVLLALGLFVLRQHLPYQPATSEVAVVMESGAAGAPQLAVPESLRSRPSDMPVPQATVPAPPGEQAPNPPHASAAPRAGSVAHSPPAPLETVPEEAMIAPPLGSVPVRPSRPRIAHVPAASGNPFASLSAPMTLSLAGRGAVGGAPPPFSAGHLQRGLLLTMAPTAANQSILTRYAEARRALGEDWWQAFSAYVEAHKYYPMSAAQRGEDGLSTLRMTVARDGTVEAVGVEISSGSQTLDEAWVSEFRGKKVPAFPPGTTQDRITFSASMSYILEQVGG